MSVPRRGPLQKSEPTAFPTLQPFAKRLESLRLERGFTQRALAERAKISTTYYQDIAHARANPTVAVALALAHALGVSVVDLFESTAPPPDDVRVIFRADLRDLAATHSRLTDIVERLTKDETLPRPRRTKRRPGC